MGRRPRTPPGSVTDEYLVCLSHGDLTGALDTVIPLLDSTANLQRVLDVLAAGQAEVGVRWQRGEWTIAQEHAATAITERVAAALASAVIQPEEHPALVLVCAEGEWHTLPPLLLAEALRAQRWDVRFLGGSVPPPDLRAHLAAVRPLALGVSCTVPQHLGGALAAITAGHAVGVPVLAGGRAFSTSPLRAAALGADGWALDARAAANVLEHWEADGVRGFAGPDANAVTAATQLRSEAPAILALVEEELSAHSPPTGPLVRRSERELLGELLEALVSAVLTADHTVLGEHLPWALQLRRARGGSTEVVSALVSSLGKALVVAGFPDASEVLQRAAASAEG